MYCNSDPPKEQNRGDFPSFEYSSVSVDLCWYYLSLLERFVDTTKDMAEDDLKMYLVRAEYRYFQFISNKVPKRKISSLTPPLDIAFFWQAHMLSPMRFYEDALRVPPFYYEKVPLKAIHQAYKNNAKILQANEWKKIMGDDEPYDLTIEALHDKNSYACVTCIVCFTRIQSPWNEYTEWRTDHSTALLCHCCYATFTVKHVGKANLYADNAKKSDNISGLKLDSKGKVKTYTTEQQLLSPFNKDNNIKSLPFNRGLKPLEDYMKKNQSHPLSKAAADVRKEVLNAIQSTYLCTPYRRSSLDLIQAVARQYKFAFKVTKTINWNVPDGIIHGIRNYSKFLEIIKKNPRLLAVPTIEIDLAWHTHMLHHNKYRNFCISFVGRIINHDDTIPEEDLATSIVKTDLAWKANNRSIQNAKKKMPDDDTLTLVEQITTVTNEKEQGEDLKKNDKKEDMKSKIKRLFSLKKNKKKEEYKVQSHALHSFATSDTLVQNQRLQNEHTTMPEHNSVLEKKYSEGNYKTIPINILDTDYPEIKTKEEQDPFYNKKNISYHDKKSVEKFIKLKNDSQLINKLFAETKASGYGFIGTSTCANTDYLDQWVHLQQDRDERANDDDSDRGTSPTSKYSKVFLTQKVSLKFTLDGALQLPTIQKSTKTDKKINNQFSSFSKAHQQATPQSNTSSANFNWQQISQVWFETNNVSSCNRINSSCGGGWSNCCGNDGVASCVGISVSCEPQNSTPTTNTSGSTTYKGYSGCSMSSYTHNNDINSSSGGGSSSCGGGSSSCGGG